MNKDVLDVDVTYTYVASDDDRSQIETWIGVNDCTLISRIWVSQTAVSIDGLDGPFKFRTGAAVRHGKLADELTEALFSLGRTMRWH
ncbi:MAG: hypothetical protein QOE09_1014 [Ilumatobacteraceae bacterium]|jgi:hypothetical protein